MKIFLERFLVSCFEYHCPISHHSFNCILLHLWANGVGEWSQIEIDYSYQSTSTHHLHHPHIYSAVFDFTDQCFAYFCLFIRILKLDMAAVFCSISYGTAVSFPAAPLLHVFEHLLGWKEKKDQQYLKCQGREKIVENQNKRREK